MDTLEFKRKLEESLDLHFPKGKCQERGSALLMFADTVVLVHQMFDGK